MSVWSFVEANTTNYNSCLYKLSLGLILFQEWNENEFFNSGNELIETEKTFFISCQSCANEFLLTQSHRKKLFDSVDLYDDVLLKW